MAATAQLHRERRREIEEKLAEHGLVKGPRRLSAAMPLAFDDEAFAARLGGALAELGPLYANLGRYLATRLDVLAARDALELMRIDDRAPAAPAEQVREILRRELAAPVDAVFRRLDPRPMTSRLLSQTHRAELVTGEPVLVRWIRPGLAGRVELELEAAAALPDTEIAKIKALVGDVRSLAVTTLDSVHKIIFDLRPSVLDDLGLTMTRLTTHLAPRGVTVAFLPAFLPVPVLPPRP